MSSDEWNTVTARHRQARATVTPMENRYSKSVKDYIAKADLKPMVGNVTSLNVDNFREIVAQALSKIKSRYTSEVAMYAGYSFFVESELGFQLRCRDETIQLPPPQPFPTKPRSESTAKMKKYYRDLDSYNII
mmetsp:Transcript_13194/g.27032  ORF Transcript_13194/g.27032 Transcript_13194/m.27032 type:complete len:133 (+) Transcript_13194:187-585(+)